MTKRYALSFCTFLLAGAAFAQMDSITLKEVEIKERRFHNGRKVIKAIENGIIQSSKKVDIIDIKGATINKATNNQREVFSRVAGVHIWENDGSGVQVGIATRGLSPNRSWEFNVRQNGYDVSSDIFGYPEAYYNPPMEAVDRIQIIRGASGLQFGPQFGGMLNYELKRAPKKEGISFESHNTVGSFGLFNSYNGLGFRRGALSGYGYYNSRRADGWRVNSRYQIDNAYGSLQYAITDKLSIGAEVSTLMYVNQQAAGLTDAQFNTDARQSNRSRNWFSTPWVVPALTLDWKVNDNNTLRVKTFGLLGERNSVGYTQGLNVRDTINRSTGDFNPRQVDRDLYRNIGVEARLQTDYTLFGFKGTQAAGLRYYTGYTKRWQQGTGTTGSDFNLALASDYRRSLDFNVSNVAAFVEENIYLTEDWTITPGVRIESIQNTSKGSIGVSNGNPINIEQLSRSRTVFLAGLGTQYNFNPLWQVYANISQAYRPITFANLTPSATTDIVDQNLKDSEGFNADLGLRTRFTSWFAVDVSGFYMRYNNRIGTLPGTENNLPINFITNVGASNAMGAELYLEADILGAIFPDNKYGSLNMWSSTSFTDARYAGFKERSGTTEINLDGNRVQDAPAFVERIGLSYQYKGLGAQISYNSVSNVFSDARNTSTANALGTVGEIPGYQIWDLGLGYEFSKYYSIRTGVNNLFDTKYFTRRAGGYPGPGLLPGDGRSIYMTLGFKL